MDRETVARALRDDADLRRRILAKLERRHGRRVIEAYERLRRAAQAAQAERRRAPDA